MEAPTSLFGEPALTQPVIRKPHLNVNFSFQTRYSAAAEDGSAPKAFTPTAVQPQGVKRFSIVDPAATTRSAFHLHNSDPPVTTAKGSASVDGHTTRRDAGDAFVPNIRGSQTAGPNIRSFAQQNLQEFRASAAMKQQVRNDSVASEKIRNSGILFPATASSTIIGGGTLGAKPGDVDFSGGTNGTSAAGPAANLKNPVTAAEVLRVSEATRGTLAKGSMFEWNRSQETYEVVATLFQAADSDGDGDLMWNPGEVTAFTKMIFEAYDVPMPTLSNTQWYLLYKEFDENDRYRLNLSEAMQMAQLIHTKQVNNDMDFANALIPASYRDASISTQQKVAEEMGDVAVGRY